jgi:hypothetical protein
MRRLSASLLLSMVFSPAGLLFGAAPEDIPRPVPTTRPEMKRLLEDVKIRTPRIPLPELTDEEQEKLGTQADSYESRLRFHYLKGVDDGRNGNPMGRTGQGGAGRTGGGGGGRQEQEAGMTLENAFKVELFWIVSRVNNCQYCMGHQESKLLAAGLSEDQIAALDSDWSGFKPAEQAAFAFARKFSFEPHRLSDADIVELRKFYTDPQILEMILSMAGNNSINRWKEGVGVPQRKDEGGFSRVGRTDPTAPLEPGVVPKLPRGSYLTPTSPAFEKKVSRVAAIVVDSKTGEPTAATVCDRPALESRPEVEKLLAACRQRKSRLPLVDETAAKTIVGDKWAATGPLPNWVRLLATFPKSGVSRIASIKSTDEKGDLSPLLKAQLSWIIARQDRAWYAVGHAKMWLRQLGQTDEQIYGLDGDWKGFTPREQALFTVVKHLGASPVVLTDREVNQAVELAGPRDVVQTISYTTNRASFDRITEAAGLQLEE